MRVVSDFLDRVAARVIGGDTAMLAPRVPSIYEPTQATANAPLEQSLSVAAEAASLHSEGTHTSAHASSSEAPSTHTPASAQRDDVHVRTQAATTTDEQTRRSSAIPSRRVAKPSLEQHTVIEPLTRGLARQSREEERSAQAAPPLATMCAAAVPDPAVGVLLPPEQPVFGASIGMAAKQASAPERSRSTTVRAQRVTHEPVVHVSIGRIEVRASAATASTPRRQGGAPVDRLGDYLRERNKASP